MEGGEREENFSHKIKEFSESNQRGLEITIYIEFNPFSASNQIGLKIIYIEMLALNPIFLLTLDSFIWV